MDRDLVISCSFGTFVKVGIFVLFIFITSFRVQKYGGFSIRLLVLN